MTKTGLYLVQCNGKGPAQLALPGPRPTPRGGADMADRICSIPGCGGPHEARGWCPMPAPGTLAHERGLGPCWLWIPPPNTGGYGVFVGDGEDKAHRYAYVLLVGPIPDELTLDHLCRIRHCVNPEHLEPVTQAVNNQRAAKTECDYGHDWSDPRNVYNLARGGRRCAECSRISTRKRRQAARLKVAA